MENMGLNARSLSLMAHFGGAKHASALATHYYALFDAHPLAGGHEPTIGTGGYGRATVTNGAAVYGTPGLGTTQIANLADIVWPAATGLWSITADLPWCAIFSAPTGGTLWYALELPEPKRVAAATEQPRVLAGGLIIRQGG
jgi:hypothetical protein